MSEFNEQDNIIEEETPVLHLELEDGTEQDCAVIALFSVEELNDQEYIALVSIEDLELSLIHIFFGEITPKTYATINNTKIALSYASSIYLVTKLLTPIVYLINKLSTGILMIFHIDSKQSKRIMTERELRTIVDVSHEDGVIEEAEKDMLNNVFDFKESLAKDIMIPRLDVTFVSVDASYEEVLEIFREAGSVSYTHLDVYKRHDLYCIAPAYLLLDFLPLRHKKLHHCIHSLQNENLFLL